MIVPPLDRTITLTDMVAYAGATWDWHRLHYDPAFLATKGLDRPVVDGQMLGALMAEQILDALGPDAFVTNLALRYKAMVFAGDTVTVEATTDDDELFHQRIHVGERLVAEGSTKVRRG